MLSRKRRWPSAEQNVESERRFSRAAQSGDDDHLVARDRDDDVLQIVLARAVNLRSRRLRFVPGARASSAAPVGILLNGSSAARSEISLAVILSIAKRSRRSPWRDLEASRRILDCAQDDVTQKSSGVRALNLRDLLRCSSGDDLAAFVAGFRSEIDDPVGAFNHFEIVLDHDERMPGVDQSLEQLQQNRDIIEMQSGGRFVEDEKIAA